MNQQQTVYNLLRTGNPRSIADIVTETGLQKKSVIRAIRTLISYQLAKKSVSPDGKTKLYQTIEARKRPDIRGKILACIEEKGSATPAEVAAVIGVADDYVRHSLRCMLDQRILTREALPGGRSWRYAIATDDYVYGRSERMTAFYGCVLPVQQARMAA